MMIVIFTFVIYVNDKFHRLISAILQLPNIVSVLSLALHSLQGNFHSGNIQKHLISARGIWSISAMTSTFSCLTVIA